MIHAFPHNTVVVDKEGGIVQHHTGMTLRDYFAARYMQGLAANPTCTATFHGGGLHETSEWAYRMADAMLKAREA